MMPGSSLCERLGFGRYVREMILPFAPSLEPVPFRGRRSQGDEPLPFFDELERDLLGRPGSVWNVLGLPGTGKSHLGRWAAARWGRQFLERPDSSPLPLFIEYRRIHEVTFGFQRFELASILAASGAGLSRELRQQSVALLREHPVILIVDRQHFPAARIELFERVLQDHGNFRVLHLGLEGHVTGQAVRLSEWDYESAQLAAYRGRGAEGIERLEAVLSSAASDLLAYPLFVRFLVEAKDVDGSTLACDGGVRRFLRWLHELHRAELRVGSATPTGSEAEFIEACRRLLAQAHGAFEERSALGYRLHFYAPPGEKLARAWGGLFRAYLLDEVARGAGLRAALQGGLLSESDLDVIEKVLGSERLAHRVLASSSIHARRFWSGFREPPRAVEASNFVNLKWRLGQKIVPEKALRSCSQVYLPNYRFLRTLQDLALAHSNLRGISVRTGRARSSDFTSCDLSEADLEASSIRRCRFFRCQFRLARLDETSFRQCYFEELDFSEAILDSAVFADCSLQNVVFGWMGAGEEIRFIGSDLRECDLTRLAPAGFFWDRCRLYQVHLCGIETRGLFAQGTRFSHCDFQDLVAPDARLHGARFEDSILAGVDLRGADLRRVIFVRTEFQATAPRPFLGSFSRGPEGYRLEDLGLGELFGDDADVVRTADLRGADLRGVELYDTDLYRVDLRGARLDPSLRKLAREMQAFVDPDD